MHARTKRGGGGDEVEVIHTELKVNEYSTLHTYIGTMMINETKRNEMK